MTLGIKGEGDVQIAGGVTADDLVITTGAYGIDEGTKVKVGPAESDDADDADKDKGGN